jgi:hypothetical protein
LYTIDLAQIGKGKKQSWKKAGGIWVVDIFEKAIINFDFSEVNSAVFRYAQIYWYKKQGINREIVVITPDEFKYLFANADYLAVINKDWLNINYRIISEYLGDRKQKYYIDSGLEALCLNKLRQLFPDFEYTRVDSFVDLNYASVKYDRLSWLIQQFLNLENAIAAKNLYMNFTGPDLLIEKMANEGVRKFIDFQGVKVVIRTRNFKSNVKISKTTG